MRRIRHTAKPLPRDWSDFPGVVAENDIKLTPKSRLAAKLLVFKNRKALNAFWANCLGRPMGFGALGAVNALATEHVGPEGVAFIECDPRYFCVIGLVIGHLSMEIITHESVHAGFAFANRHKRDFWVPQTDEFCEEDVCYPAGRIAKRINAFLYDKGLYQQ
jgi:hypothetical protein